MLWSYAVAVLREVTTLLSTLQVAFLGVWFLCLSPTSSLWGWHRLVELIVFLSGILNLDLDDALHLLSVISLCRDAVYRHNWLFRLCSRNWVPKILGKLSWRQALHLGVKIVRVTRVFFDHRNHIVGELEASFISNTHAHGRVGWQDSVSLVDEWLMSTIIKTHMTNTAFLVLADYLIGLANMRLLVLAMLHLAWDTIIDNWTHHIVYLEAFRLARVKRLHVSSSCKLRASMGEIQLIFFILNLAVPWSLYLLYYSLTVISWLIRMTCGVFCHTIILQTIDLPKNTFALSWAFIVDRLMP